MSLLFFARKKIYFFGREKKIFFSKLKKYFWKNVDVKIYILSIYAVSRSFRALFEDVLHGYVLMVWFRLLVTPEDRG